MWKNAFAIDPKFRWPWLFFYAGFFTCTWDRLLAHEFGGFTLKFHQISFLCCFLSLALLYRREFPERIWRALRENPAAVALALLPIYYLAMLPLSFFPLKTFLYGCWLIFNLVAILGSALLLAEHVPWRLWFQMIFLTSLSLCLVIFIDQYAFYHGYPDGLLGFNQNKDLQWDASRPAAFSFEPSYVASFFVCALIIQLGEIWQRKRLANFLFLGFSAIVLALIFTTSRTGWFGFALGLAFMAFVALLFGKDAKVKATILKTAIISVLAIGLAGVFTPTTQRDRILSQLVFSIAQGRDGSGNSRLIALQSAATMAAETHGLGAGLGASFRFYMAKHDPKYQITSANYGDQAMMSTWGELLAEGGIPAVLLYLAAAFLFVRSLWAKFRQTQSMVSLGILSSALIFFVFIAIWIPNIARGDVWVWYALWLASLKSA